MGPLEVMLLEGAPECSEDGRELPGKPAAMEPAGVRDGLLPAPAAPLGGADKFVDKFMISLPCTTRLSFDFFRSRVSISVGTLVGSTRNCKIEFRTIFAIWKFHHISDSDVYYSQEALILLLELLLIKHLNCEYTVLGCTPRYGSAPPNTLLSRNPTYRMSHSNMGSMFV
jgi:hypothetical protein